VNFNNLPRIENTCPNRVVPKFPVAFHMHHKTGSAVLHTESTTYIDSEEDSFMHTGEIHQGSQPKIHHFHAYPNSVPPELESNNAFAAQVIASPLQNHSKTRSYDQTFMSNSIQINPNPYIQSPMNFYQSGYMESPEYQWEESMQPFYYYPGQQQFYGDSAALTPSGHENKPGARRRNPEREEEKAKFAINLEAILSKADTRTTLMIKNIPNKYSQVMLLKKLDVNHKKTYDFFYLVLDFKVCFMSTKHS